MSSRDRDWGVSGVALGRYFLENCPLVEVDLHSAWPTSAEWHIGCRSEIGSVRNLIKGSERSCGSPISHRMSLKEGVLKPVADTYFSLYISDIRVKLHYKNFVCLSLERVKCFGTPCFRKRTELLFSLAFSFPSFNFFALKLEVFNWNGKLTVAGQLMLRSGQIKAQGWYWIMWDLHNMF